MRGRPALAAEERRVAPASFGQASLWFLRQVMPYPSSYNTAVELRLDGVIDAGAMEAAWREIVRRHESFRTTFTVTEGTVLQVISAEMPADVTTTDLTSAADPEGDALRLARAAASAPFDLDRGPLLRVRLLRLAAHRHALVVVMDHIVADGMSLGILWRELSALYRAFRAGEPSPLAPPAKQYAACVEAQSRWLKTPAFARQLKYWTDHLAGAAACDLPADRPRPPVRSFRGDLAVIELPAALTARLRAVAERDEVSLFAALLAGLDVLLARYSGQDDVVVMIPIACRQRFAAEEVVGFFANMVVLRTQVAGRQSYRELVRRVNKEIMGGVFRQDVPFEKVIEALRPDRSLSHDPLASIALSFLPAHAATLELPGVVTTYGEIPNGGSKFDLHFVIAEHADHLSCSAEYNSDVFDAETIRDLLEHYRLLLGSASAAPEDATADLRLLGPAEEHRIVTEWNETRAEYLRGATLPDLFAAAAARSPDAPALWFEGESETFHGLDRRSNQVARALRARGAGPGTLVGIAVERSIAMVVGLLGILKSGAAYVPLDPAYPRERLALMAEDSSLRLLVTEDRFADLVPAPPSGGRDGGAPHTPGPGIRVGGDPHTPGPAGAWMLRLDGDAAEIAAQHDGPLESAIHPEAIAYVIYTSGSTGRPKGVQIPHRAVVNFLTTMARLPGLAATDRLLAVTSLSFDIAGLELWLPLTRGAQVEVASRETAGNGAALRRILETGRITVIQATPSTFRLLLEAGWERTPGLKVLVGGEATPRELADKLAERADSVWNMYGPTETTIWSCVHPLARGAPVLIGRPIANTRAYILDRDLSPVPAGVTGELYLGGDGVAHGYLGRPDLTAQRFIPDGCSGRSGGRLYRTGDLARHRADGEIEFFGRADFQVKFRGHRIELGEIEATLAEHPAVREAIVSAYEETPGDQRLVAYLTLAGAADAELLPQLRAHLRAKLPEYMVPARFMVLERLPLTANNKIDRRALPSPREATVAVSGADAGPRGALDVKLLAIWEDLLGVTGIGMRDSFFDVGGHSLLALKLFDRIERAFGVKLPVASLFQAPTIATLAQLVRREGWTPSWHSLVPIQTEGRRRPFFCVHAMGGNVLNYRLLSRHLGDDQPFYGLQARGLGGNEAPHTTVEEMAAAYIAEIKQEQPRGPYALGGASAGGVVAFEMAQQLLAVGDRVSALVLLDTYRAGPPHPRVIEARTASPIHRPGMLLDYHLGMLLLRTPREGVSYLAERVRARFGGTSGPVAQAIQAAMPAVRHVIETNMRALQSYVPRPYPGTAVMLLSRDEPDRAFYDGRLAWADLLADGLVLRFIPGSHENMLEEPQVARVAAVIARCLG